MIKYKTDLIIFAGLAALVSVISLITVEQDTIDVQLHDTYFVLDKMSIFILILGPLASLIFLLRAATKRFCSIGANTGLVIGLVLMSLITYRTIELEGSYLNLIDGLEDDYLNKKNSVADMEGKINFTWGLFGLWISASVLLTLRTIKLWKEWYDSRQNI